jgi:hypothetical protein
MQITTKFSTNETVYFLHGPGIKSGTVDSITAKAVRMSGIADIGACNSFNAYIIVCESRTGSFEMAETLLFASAEECAAALVKEAE